MSNQSLLHINYYIHHHYQYFHHHNLLQIFFRPHIFNYNLIKLNLQIETTQLKNQEHIIGNLIGSSMICNKVNIIYIVQMFPINMSQSDKHHLVYKNHFIKLEKYQNNLDTD